MNALKISSNGRYLVDSLTEKPVPLFGDTAWGLTERPDRAGVNTYIANRKAKGFNILLVCLFWGKREGSAASFTTNPENYYGHRAFAGGSTPDGSTPLVVADGTPISPNDYWDNVDYLVQKAEESDMYLCFLPAWGRRYVNATHTGQSYQTFTEAEMRTYGEFLGERYKNEPHIIWAMGGDVDPEDGSDYKGHYRAMAEGICKGTTDVTVVWDTPNAAWNDVILTYHPPGYRSSSSSWFHTDEWLSNNMCQIGTMGHDNEHIYPDMYLDYQLLPTKPTFLGESGYEGSNGGIRITPAIIRMEAFHSFFAGGCGYIYGNMEIDFVWTFFGDWELLLDSPGAVGMTNLINFMSSYDWYNFHPDQNMIVSGESTGITRKVVQTNEDTTIILVYYPTATECTIDMNNVTESYISAQWYNPVSNAYQHTGIVNTSTPVSFIPPLGWEDAILILNTNTPYTGPRGISRPESSGRHNTRGR